MYLETGNNDHVRGKYNVKANLLFGVLLQNIPQT
jgi:hypothetical protein